MIFTITQELKSFMVFYFFKLLMATTWPVYTSNIVNFRIMLKLTFLDYIIKIKPKLDKNVCNIWRILTSDRLVVIVRCLINY